MRYVQGSNTIYIDYQFPAGKQGKEHPHPGQHYGADHRAAYLPDTHEGREVLRLFKLAWRRRLLFNIGKSLTVGGDQDRIIWNGIHHVRSAATMQPAAFVTLCCPLLYALQKTNTAGGPASFGYPDPTYFTRVKEELAQKGVL